MPTKNLPLNNAGAMTPSPLGNGGTIQSVSCSSLTVGNGPSINFRQIASNNFPSNNANAQAARFRKDEWLYGKLLREPNLAIGDTALQSYLAMQNGTSLAATVNANEEVLVPDSLSALAFATQISQNSLSEINHQQVLAIRLNGVELDSIAQVQLEGIALQCEAEGGKAVNIARGLLASEGNMIWEDPSCTSNARQIEGQEAEAMDPSESHITCYPNPSSGMIYVSSVIAATGELSVYDVHGKLLLRQRANLGEEPIEISGHNWSQGLILVQFRLDNGGLNTWRILIER